MYRFNNTAPTRVLVAAAFTSLTLILGVSAAEAHTNDGAVASRHKSHHKTCSAGKKRIGGRCVPVAPPSPSAQAEAQGQSQSSQAIGARVQAAQTVDNGDGTTNVIIGPGTPEPGGVTNICMAAANQYARYIYPYYYRNVWITNCDGTSYWYSSSPETTYQPDYAGYYVRLRRHRLVPRQRVLSRSATS
jgi:hypothetical protein